MAVFVRRDASLRGLAKEAPDSFYTRSAVSPRNCTEIAASHFRVFLTDSRGSVALKFSMGHRAVQALPAKLVAATEIAIRVKRSALVAEQPLATAVVGGGETKYFRR
jgi:hypothetical protein